jgi:formylmethanofuran dehydrogenase subunit C
MPVILRLKRQPTVPLEAEHLSPDLLATLSHAEIGALIVHHGKRRLPLSEFFDIEGERSEDLVLHGELHKLRWVGRGMHRGTVTVHGSIGMHLGAYMRGGRIDVHGNAGDWVGAEMKDGTIHIRGNAGGQIGAAYRGAMSGMRNGLIVIDGSAGIEVGMRMRRGTIVVGGPTRDFTGLQMKGGTIILRSGAEIRTGAWMQRGTIISLRPLQLMPTFTFATTTHPGFLPLLARHLAPHGITLPAGPYQLYRGDRAIPGKGEILVLA